MFGKWYEEGWRKCRQEENGRGSPRCLFCLFSKTDFRAEKILCHTVQHFDCSGTRTTVWVRVSTTTIHSWRQQRGRRGVTGSVTADPRQVSMAPEKACPRYPMTITKFDFLIPSLQPFFFSKAFPRSVLHGRDKYTRSIRNCFRADLQICPFPGFGEIRTREATIMLPQV